MIIVVLVAIVFVGSIPVIVIILCPIVSGSYRSRSSPFDGQTTTSDSAAAVSKPTRSPGHHHRRGSGFSDRSPASDEPPYRLRLMDDQSQSRPLRGSDDEMEDEDSRLGGTPLGRSERPDITLTPDVIRDPRSFPELGALHPMLSYLYPSALRGLLPFGIGSLVALGHADGVELSGVPPPPPPQPPLPSEYVNRKGVCPSLPGLFMNPAWVLSNPLLLNPWLQTGGLEGTGLPTLEAHHPLGHVLTSRSRAAASAAMPRGRFAPYPLPGKIGRSPPPTPPPMGHRLSPPAAHRCRRMTPSPVNSPPLRRYRKSGSPETEASDLSHMEQMIHGLDKRKDGADSLFRIDERQDVIGSCTQTKNSDIISPCRVHTCE